MVMRRKTWNGKPTIRARQVRTPWSKDPMAAIGASLERWVLLHGLAALCGPITTRHATEATGWPGELTRIEMQWAMEAGWLTRTENPEHDPWVPQHAAGAKPRWLWHAAGSVVREKPVPKPRGNPGMPRKRKRSGKPA